MIFFNFKKTLKATFASCHGEVVQKRKDYPWNHPDLRTKSDAKKLSRSKTTISNQRSYKNKINHLKRKALKQNVLIDELQDIVHRQELEQKQQKMEIKSLKNLLGGFVDKKDFKKMVRKDAL